MWLIFVSCNIFVLSGPQSSLKLVVGVEVMKGYEPIIGAKVEVQVGSTPWKPLNDNGQGRYIIPQ